MQTLHVLHMHLLRLAPHCLAFFQKCVQDVTYVVAQALLISVIAMALKWLEEVRISSGIFSSNIFTFLCVVGPLSIAPLPLPFLPM